MPTLMASLAGEPTLSLSTGPVTINFSPSPLDLLHALLSPVRWFGPATDPAYIPGALVWTVLLPAIVLGCWDLLRRGPWAARGLVLSALAFLYLYTCDISKPGIQPTAIYGRDLVPGDRPVRIPAAPATGGCLHGSLRRRGRSRPVGFGGSASAHLHCVLGDCLGCAVDCHGLDAFDTRQARQAKPGIPSACPDSGGTQAYGGHSGSEPELKLTLARATSTGVRVMGLRISGYAVGFVASILIARALGPTGRGLYAYPVALLGLVMALAHLGLEFAQVHLAAQGQGPAPHVGGRHGVQRGGRRRVLGLSSQASSPSTPA